MKTSLTLVLIFFLLLVALVSYSKPKPQKDFTVLSTKKLILYFKVNKSFVGGIVEVYDANKNFMEAEDLPHTHTMIYFEDMPTGHYVIKMKKGEKTAEFKYDNI